MDIIFLIAGYLIFFALPAWCVYRLHTRGRIWTILHYVNWFAIVIFVEEAVLLGVGTLSQIYTGDPTMISIGAYTAGVSLIFPLFGLLLINILACIILIIVSLVDATVRADIFGMMIGFGQKPEEESDNSKGPNVI